MLTSASSALMVLLNAFEQCREELGRKEIEIFLKLTAPFAPFLTEELWREKLGNKKSIHIAPWPLYNPRLAEEETHRLIVEINGKMRDTIEIAKGITQKEAERAAFASSRANPHLEGKKIKKIIFIPNRLINFVV
jgi:leucyl-tRNA synthetase